MLSKDEQIGAKTTGIDIYMEIPFGRSTTVAFLDATFEHLHIEQVDNATGDIIKTIDMDGKTIGCKSLSEYLFSEPKYRRRVVLDGFTWLRDSTLRVQFTGSVSIEAMVVGRSQSLGCTLYGTQLRPKFSGKVKIDEITGFRSIVSYGSVRILDAKIVYDTGEFNSIVQKINEIVGVNVLWIPTNEDRFSEMNNIAYIEQAPLPVQNAIKNETNITMIGVM